MHPDIAARLPRPERATRFWWVRHARVPEVADRMYGSLDVDCETTDAARFEGVAARLPANAVWVTSPLARTRQTAEALVAAGAPEPRLWLEPDPDVAELDFGDYNGMTHLELFSTRKDDPFLGFWPMSPHERAPNGESFTMMRDRVARFVDRTVAAHPGADVVVASHRGPILAALQIALELPLDTSVAFTIDNVSLTRLRHHGDAARGGPHWRVEEVAWLPGAVA